MTFMTWKKQIARKAAEAATGGPDGGQTSGIEARANALYERQMERAIGFAENTASSKDGRDNAKKVSN